MSKHEYEGMSAYEKGYKDGYHNGYMDAVKRMSDRLHGFVDMARKDPDNMNPTTEAQIKGGIAAAIVFVKMLGDVLDEYKKGLRHDQ